MAGFGMGGPPQRHIEEKNREPLPKSIKERLRNIY